MPEKIDKNHYQYDKEDNYIAYLLLHGFNGGIKNPFIDNIRTNALKRRTVLALEFPYVAKKSKPSNNLLDEIDAVDTAVEFLKQERFKHIVIVGKSLGGIVASKWLSKNPTPEIPTDVVIFGYVLGDVDTDALRGHLKLVIQGENDEYGSSQQVEEELLYHSIDDYQIIGIEGADHSYRNDEGEPEYQSLALMKLHEFCKNY